MKRTIIDGLPALAATAKVVPIKLIRSCPQFAWCAVRARFILLVCIGLISAEISQATCTAPPSMKAQLASKPSADAYADLGKWFGERKQYRCAAQAFASAFKLQPDSASFATMWGLSLYSAGETEAAIDPLRRAASLNPADARPHLVLGSALDGAGRTAEAEREWRAALAIDPGSAAALDQLSSDLLSDKDYAGIIALLEQPARQPQRTAQQNLNLGLAYAKTLQLHEAEKVLHDGLDSTPDSAPLANELAVVLMLLERPEDADKVLTTALDRHPGDLNTQVLYLRVLVSRHADNAMQFGKKLILVAPRNWEVLYLNAQLAMRDGDLPTARAYLERSVALKSDYYQSHTELANVLFSLKDLPGAKAQLEKAIELGDQEPAVQYQLAKVLQNLGETAQAQEKMQVYQAMRKAEADRALAVGKIELGDRAMAAGDAAQAVAFYREAIADAPNEARIAYKLARALEKTNDLTGEKAELERAIQLDPHLAEAQNQLGYLAGKSGDLAQAESCYRAAVHASPSYLVAWINLAATLADEAKWQEARQAASHALEIDPNSAEARRLAEAIVNAQAHQ